MSAAGGRLPANLIVGFGGVGKTTLLNRWLVRRPAGERWAVMLNTSGEVQVDIAARPSEQAPGHAQGVHAPGHAVEVVEVPGGCACCAADVTFRSRLTRLLRAGPWDRLLIETGGFGHPHRLVDRLREPAFAAMIEVQPPMLVVDARRAAPWLDSSHPAHEAALAQAALARQVLINRSEMADPQTVERLAQAIAAMSPWPAQVRRLGPDLPAFEAEHVGTAKISEDTRGSKTGPRGAGTTGTWLGFASRSFDRRRLEAALRRLSDPAGPLRAHGLLDMKGVFRTERAWYQWQWENGAGRWSESAWRLDNRLETLAIRPVDPKIIEVAIATAG